MLGLETLPWYLSSLVIVAARITDVSLGTLRTIFIVQGRTWAATGLGFVEVMVWVVVVTEVVQNLVDPVFVLSYATGFAAGTFVGMRIEAWLGPGRQVVRVFTRKGQAMAQRLRDEGYAVTEFVGRGVEGPIDLILFEIPRRRATRALPVVRDVDDRALVVVDDVRTVVSPAAATTLPPMWMRFVKRK